MEIIHPVNAYEWIDNCPHCRVPMAKVLLTSERIRIDPSTIVGGDPKPGWYYSWSQRFEFISGSAAQKSGDYGPRELPTWYCAMCIKVWVIFRGLYFCTDFNPMQQIQGIVNAGLGEAPALRQGA
jgi:hypothetical protein